MASRKSGIATLAALVLLPAVATVTACGQDGAIAGVSADPSTTQVNQAVTVTVSGTNPSDGTCSQVVVRCDAPAAPEHVKRDVELPFNVTCTYASTGAKTVTASAELVNADCPGDKITQVTVNGG
jgi:hypothetical protein